MSIKSTNITEEQLRSVDHLSVRLAAQQLGVGKTTVSDARALRAANGGYLPKPTEGAATLRAVNPADVPDSYKETFTGDEGVIEATVSEDLSYEDILRKFGRDPQKYRLVEGLTESHWGDDERGWKHSYKFKTEKVKPDFDIVSDLPLLYSEVMAELTAQTRLVEPQDSTADITNVIVWADPQTGKRDSRGGTPELIKRMAEAKAALQEWLYWHPSENAAFLSVGDEVESFENVGSQPFTNDLSFPDQLDLELTFELDFIRLLAGTHSSVVVAGTSSNHCRWRKGKDDLGTPGDDYGLYLKKQLEKALRLNPVYDHVEFVHPSVWDETNAVTVSGTKIAMAHGHQVSNPNGIVDWWKKQAFGRQASADADILITGHFHHFRMEEVNAGKDGLEKARFWIQAPTMDNGSSWVRNKWGNDSSPGILVFQVNQDGLILGSLNIL